MPWFRNDFLMVMCKQKDGGPQSLGVRRWGFAASLAGFEPPAPLFISHVTFGK